MKQIILDFGVLDLVGRSIPIRIYAYGLMLVLGFVVGMWLAQWRAKRAGEGIESVTACGILALTGGIVGSRIAYVIQHWDSQFASAENRVGAVLNLTSGGLIYYGGVVLALVLVIGYLLAKRLSVRRYLDFLAVSMMVGLAFGRTGCLLNGCCYGARCSYQWPIGMRFPMYSKPLIKLDGRENPFSLSTDMPSPVYWHQMQTGQIQVDPRLLDASGKLIAPRYMTAEQIDIASASRSLPVQPAQALGIVNALVIAMLTWAFYRLRKREGQAFAAMLMMYAVSRFMLESIRDDNAHNLLTGVLTHNQYTSIAMFISAIAIFLALLRLPSSAGPPVALRDRSRKQADVGTRLQGLRKNSNRNRKR